MKKVKVILTAVSALAVVGVALAFKADKFSGETELYTKGAGTACNILTTVYTTSNSQLGTAIQASTQQNGNCQTFYTSTREF